MCRSLYDYYSVFHLLEIVTGDRFIGEHMGMYVPNKNNLITNKEFQSNEQNAKQNIYSEIYPLILINLLNDFTNVLSLYLKRLNFYPF